MLALMRMSARNIARVLGFEVRRPPKTFLRRGDARLTITLDHLLARRLLDGTDLFFVQIGAFDGRTGDQLHDYIVRYGWQGILAEPQPRYFAELQRTYSRQPGLTLRNVAVSDRHETRTLYAIRDDVDGLPEWAAQIASFDRSRLVATGFRTSSGEIAIDELAVECVPLDALLAGVDHVDLLQIDVEGYDADIIRMFDFGRYSPAIVRFENVALSRKQHDAAIRRLVMHGYRVAIEGADTIAWHDP